MEYGVFWACARWGGHALSIELLRRTFTNESINPFWLRAIEATLDVRKRSLRTEMQQTPARLSSSENVCHSARSAYFPSPTFPQRSAVGSVHLVPRCRDRTSE
jgi:hypothetical protein